MNRLTSQRYEQIHSKQRTIPARWMFGLVAFGMLFFTGLQPDAKAMKNYGEVQDRQVIEVASIEDRADPFEEHEADSIDDPWEEFNSTMFDFNRSVDRYVLKPIATGYDWLVPDPVERAIGRAFHNVRFVPRVVNSTLQGKGSAAGAEFGRFVINTTIGLAGFFDVAGEWFGLEAPPAEDMGQTLAVHGVQAGPYLVPPLLPPTTVRDGVGFLGDLVLDPLSLLLPLAPQVASRAGQTVNDRSRNLELLDGVEEGTVDLYAAARNAYAQSRRKAIDE